ncbi:hypothetical protein SAMN02745126_05955 [Enhydrobacter aerosaccus]|uniref:Phage protein n=1 Tax=Enhydrobacter aerosaccus TaxID=225324 RepID=A0A1T4TB36_9HYPH|nr:hypothetical protein [Enhydrobacter aerosaccus]SKA37780.1 hypothetical protein SAMN02745126_05955 [Enhydrobacter aerosaccus]
MLIDQQNQFSATQAVAALGSTVSANVIDLGVARDIGGDVTDQLMLLCEVVTPFTSGGSATLQVQFQTSPDNSSWSTLSQSDAIPVANLVQGYKFLPGELPGPTQRYLRLNYVVGTAAMTAGAITASLVPSLDVQPVYPRAYVA